MLHPTLRASTSNSKNKTHIYNKAQATIADRDSKSKYAKALYCRYP